MTTTRVQKVGLVYLSMEGADYLVADTMEYAIKRTPQLGFQYLSAAVKQAGGKCKIYDQPLLRFDVFALQALLAQDEIDVLGFYSDTFLKSKVAQWIAALIESGFDKKIIVGGPGSFDSEKYLNAGAAMVCHGEGERTIVEVLEYFRGDRALGDLKGVTYKQGEMVVDTVPQEFIADIDTLPHPDRSQYPPDSYYDYHYFGMRQPYMSMLASRGCPNQCSFCASSAVLGRKVRQRKVEAVLDEIQGAIDDFGLRYIGFKDDIFGFKPDWAQAFSQGLIQMGAPVKFAINLHPMSFKNNLETSLTQLKKAGLDQVVVGLQSVDPQVLKNINRRPEEPGRVEEMVRHCKRLGITIVVEFIFGLPGDTDQTMESALEFALRVRPHHALFYVLSVLDGSQIMTDYGESGPDTGFTDEQLRKRCADYQKRFFTTPGVIGTDLVHVLRHNPRWFLRILKHWRYFINAVGIKRRRTF